MKTCRRCGEPKSLEEFGVHRQRGVARIRSYCKPCHAANAREYRDRNLEAVRKRELAYSRANAQKKRETARRWYAENGDQARARIAAAYAEDPEYNRDMAHKSRAKKYGAPVIEFVRRATVYERDEGICHVCGEHVPWGDYEMDHVMPLSKGGSHTYENVKVSHSGCNRGRRFS